MPYAAYLRLEGWCSIALGLALALLAFPGLLLDGDGTLWGLLAVPAVLLALGAWARGATGSRSPRPAAGSPTGRWPARSPAAGRWIPAPCAAASSASRWCGSWRSRRGS
jgi:hypothetical protein